MNENASALLADAFELFISASGQLEHSYRMLQGEVTRLRAELEERNAALADSLAENERSRGELQHILDSLPCGVVVYDTKSERVLLTNPEAKRMLDLPVSWPPDVTELPAQFLQVVRSQRLGSDATDQRELLFEGRKGRVCISIHARQGRAPRSQNGSAPTVLILRDTTQEQNLFEKREASRDQVALAHMGTVLAHEIRNPLASLELLATLLWEQGQLTGDPQEWMKHIRAGLRSLASTVNNVLSLNTPGTLELRPVQVGPLLKLIVDFIRPLAEQAGVHLILEDCREEVTIAGEPNALQQIVLNLATNAFRHTRKGGNLRVQTSVVGTQERRAVIEVQDNGEGIKSEALPHIFEPGFTTTGRTTGIGLSVCKKLVEEHHGLILVDSVVGCGTKVRLEFPAI